jgi:hypothetical protein
MVRCKTKERALARAIDIDVFMANGRVDLLQSTASELAEFRAWKAAASKHSLGIVDACAEFVALKAQKSNRYQQSLERDLALFEQFVGPTKAIGTITALDIQHFLDSRDVGQRRKFNLRVSIVSLFRWARRMSYLSDRTTEAEKGNQFKSCQDSQRFTLQKCGRFLRMCARIICRAVWQDSPGSGRKRLRQSTIQRNRGYAGKILTGSIRSSLADRDFQDWGRARGADLGESGAVAGTVSKSEGVNLPAPAINNETRRLGRKLVAGNTTAYAIILLLSRSHHPGTSTKFL